MNAIAFNVIFKRIKAIRFMMVDKAVPFRKKLLIVIGLIYLFMPFDLIPPVIFFISWIDDLILWLWILWYLRDTLDTYWVGEKEVDLSKKFRDKKIIDDAEFEVKTPKGAPGGGDKK